MAQNMKAVKLRMKSIQSTKQITKAMELVASSKLRKAKAKADAALPAFKILRKTLITISKHNNDFTSVFSKNNGSDKWCYVVIAGDRGLAGGYNANLFKFVAAQNEDQDCIYFPVGKKANEYYARRDAEITTRICPEAAAASISECYEISKFLCEGYKKGDFGHIAVCYTEFQNMLTMANRVIPVLPLMDFAGEEYDEKAIKNIIEYKPDPETVFDAIVPELVANIIYSSVCESVASELAARRTAMDAATKNAEEMLSNLELSYNRARQASITQEITEIIAGSQS